MQKRGRKEEMMRDKKKFKEKLMAVFLAAAVAVTMIPVGMAVSTDQTEAESTYSYTVKRPMAQVNGHTVPVATFSVRDLGVKGTCCQASNTARDGSAKAKIVDNSDIRARLIYYYGYEKGYLGKTNKKGLLLARALSWESGNKTTWPLSAAEVKEFIKDMPSSVKVPNRFTCYFFCPTNGAQNFFGYKMNPPAHVTLMKTSKDTKSTAAGSSYSFKDIEYTVYDSKGKKVGKLTCKASGKTNKLTLDIGKYTVKETKTNKWYKLNTKEYTRILKSGDTWNISASDAPQMGRVKIKKTVNGNYSGSLAFTFKLTNTANTKIQYKVKTDAKTGTASVDVVKGTYRCEEILPGDSELIDVTGRQTATIGLGETYTFKRENKAPATSILRVTKTTNDGGPVEGFKFKVSGVLYNQGKLSESRVLKEADAAISDYDENIYEPGEWKVSEKDLEELNRAAANRDTGVKTVELSTTLKYKGDKEDISDIRVSAKVEINLKPVEFIGDRKSSKDSVYETDIGKQIKNKQRKAAEEEGYKISCTGFDWYGAATDYQEVKNGKLTGNTEVTLETGSDGMTPVLSEGVSCGKFTVEEVLTEEQQKRYRQPESQMKEISEDNGRVTFAFNFENEARWTDTELVKTSSDGNVSGITFRLEGTDSRGETIDTEAVTDEEGRLDFGNLYAGEYVISEKDFDPDKYENNNRLEGYNVPAQRVTITGDEERITVSFDNVPLKGLLLTKVDRETQLFLKDAAFKLFEGGRELAHFRITLDDYERAVIEMISSSEDSGIRTGTSEEQDGYSFAVIKGLREGKTYTIKEVSAPEGYAASVDSTFVFADGQKLILENSAPSIGTKAMDKATQSHMSCSNGKVTIVDNVSYSGLEAGHKYVMSGILAQGSEGSGSEDGEAQGAESVEIVKDDDGKEVTARKEFVPESSEGAMEMEFTFDASRLKCGKIVAMEQLFDPEITGENGEMTVLASHEDIEDEAQSIYFPELITTASTNGTDKITDEVKYTNLLPGEKYIMRGELMNKSTGERLLLNGKILTAEKEFVPEKKNGSVILEFPADSIELEGKTAVAFETCFLVKEDEEGVEEIEIASHRDINSKAQTVSFDVPQTGQNGPWRMLLPECLITLAAIMVMLGRIRRA